MKSTAATAGAGVWAVVAGGGTGGHVYPGLAVADALVEGDLDRTQIHFVVSRRPLDAGAVTGAGFSATAIHARGLRRRLSVANVAAVAALGWGVWQCWGLLGRANPRVVLAQGGYVSAACALAARLRGIPIVVLEANATAGAANRLAARWAAACAVAFPGAALARKVVTGLPVRDAIAQLHPSVAGEAGSAARRERARGLLGVDPGRRLVLVIGGSLGSARLNAAVEEACAVLADRGDLAVRHVVGHAAAGAGTRPAGERLAGIPLAGERLAGESGPGALHYRSLPYEDDMPVALAAADLVVGRAGGSTVAELAAAGRAALLVPLAGATGDHQAANAAAQAATGAAAVLSEDELDGGRLAAEIGGLLADPAALARMEHAAAAVGAPQAAGKVADLLRGVAAGGSAP